MKILTFIFLLSVVFAAEQEVLLTKIEVVMTDRKGVEVFFKSLEKGKQYDEVQFYKITSKGISILTPYKELIARNISNIHFSFKNGSFFRKEKIESLAGLPITHFYAHHTTATLLDILRCFPSIQKVNIRCVGLSEDIVTEEDED